MLTRRTVSGWLSARSDGLETKCAPFKSGGFGDGPPADRNGSSGYAWAMSTSQLEVPDSQANWRQSLKQEPAPRRPMLAWWAIFPALVYAAIEVVCGWPELLVGEMPSVLKISYLLGRITGGVLISLVLSWFVYRCAGRSQLAGSLAFSLLVLVNGMGVAARTTFNEVVKLGGAATRTVNRSSSASAVSPERDSRQFSFGPFRCEIPAGWTRMRPDRKHTVALLSKSGVPGAWSEGLIKVDVGRPAYPTARQTAQAFAAEGGRVHEEPILLDGVEGVRVQTDSSDLSRPREVVVVYRGGRVYLIMAAAKDSGVEHAFAQVLKSWRWELER